MPNIINEDSLLPGDLKNLVNHIFEIDNFKSKMGDDEDVVVISFTVETRAPAEDLVNFIEKGYQFVLDADMSPGELSNGKYKVFVELQRDKDISEHVSDLLYGVGKLTGIDNFKFRYHKTFNSIEATKENLETAIPADRQTYEKKILESRKDSYEQFFSKSMLESIQLGSDNILRVKKVYADPLRFKFISSGDSNYILSSITESINVNEWAEIIFLTKYFGDFNITKFGNTLMFEDNGHAVLLERL
jgi:hypothetical protein